MINPNRAYNYFESKFDLIPSTKGWFRFEFPFDFSHRDKSAGVSFQLGIVKDHRSGYVSSIPKFIMELEGINYREVKELLGGFEEKEFQIKEQFFKKTSKVELPEHFVSLLDGEGILGKRAQKYLLSRGFDLEILDLMGFGYIGDRSSEYFGYIIIPFKQNGNLVYWIARDFIGNYLKYKNPPSDFGTGKSEIFFNEDALQIYQEVNLTEGWADAHTLGENSIASLGWNLSEIQIQKILKSPVKIINIIPDKGSLNQNVSFTQKAAQIGMKLIPHKKVRIFPMEDFELDGKDVNEIGKDFFLERLPKLEFLTYSKAIELYA